MANETWLQNLAVRLKRDGSRDGCCGPHSHHSDHGKAAVLDFTVSASCKCLRGLVLVKAKWVVKSRDHVLTKVTSRNVRVYRL